MFYLLHTHSSYRMMCFYYQRQPYSAREPSATFWLLEETFPPFSHCVIFTPSSSRLEYQYPTTATSKLTIDQFYTFFYTQFKTLLEYHLRSVSETMQLKLVSFGFKLSGMALCPLNFFTYNLSQKWVHPSHVYKYFTITFYGTTQLVHQCTFDVSPKITQSTVNTV